MLRKEERLEKYTRCVAVVCDMCGRENPGSDWSTEDRSVRETEIRYKTGADLYPESGSGEELRVDLCPECFEQKLIPWLRQQGVAVVPRKWEY